MGANVVRTRKMSTLVFLASLFFLLALHVLEPSFEIAIAGKQDVALGSFAGVKREG